METGKKRTNREEWRKRIERWADSGLTAEEFASELGINPGTLRFWKYQLGRQERAAAGKQSMEVSSPLVEIRSSAQLSQDRGFELELGGERRLHIPASFEPAALQRLLAVLERKP